MGGTGVDPLSWKTDTFFLGPWLLVYQFIEIFKQMEVNGEVSNFGLKNLCNTQLYQKNYPKFETSLLTSIWLEIYINWYTKGQGPKIKCIRFSRGSTPAPPILLVIRVVLLHTLYVYGVLNPFFPNCIYIYFRMIIFLNICQY